MEDPLLWSLSGLLVGAVYGALFGIIANYLDI